MPARKPYTNLELVRRSLLPSPTSFMACLMFGILLIAVHMLLLSVANGTALPMIFDGEWGTLYTNTVVRPLTVLFTNRTFNNVLTVIVWGLLGLCVYSLVEMVTHIYKEAREAQQDVRVGYRSLVLHPDRPVFLKKLLWRSIMFILIVLFLIAIQPIMQYLLLGDAKLIEGSLNLLQSLRQLGLALIGWMLLAHIFVVLLRLLVMRTRLFGEPLY